MKKKNVYIEFILVTIIIILINMIFAKFTMRIDLTKSKKYTLSKSTKGIIKNLNDNIWVEFYISKNIPPYLTHLKKGIWDVLNEYRIISKGKIHIREIDPMSNPDLKSKLYMYGIQPISINLRSKDKAEIVQSYIGMAIFYKDKVEAIPMIQSTNDLEYNISSILLKITSPRIPVIGYPQGGSEFYLKRESPSLLTDLQKLYKVFPFDLSKKSDYDNLVEEHGKLKSQFNETEKINEKINKTMLEIEKRNQELGERVKMLETVSDETLEEMLIDWLKTNRGTLNVYEFSKINKVAPARIEEGLNILMKKGAIEKVK